MDCSRILSHPLHCTFSRFLYCLPLSLFKLKQRRLWKTPFFYRHHSFAHLTPPFLPSLNNTVNFLLRCKLAVMISHCGLCEPNYLDCFKGTLETILPSQYEHEVCSYEPLDGDNFKCQFRLKISSEEQVQKWLQDFKRGTNSSTWKVARTYPDAGKFNQFRVDLRCQHNTRYTSRPGKKTKNTFCPASAFIVLKRFIKHSRSKDSHIEKGLLFIVTLNYAHNHPLSCADALRRNDVSEATEEKLRSLFEHGHSPSSALDLLKDDLPEEHGDNYINASADRSLCPDVQYCYRLYAKIFKKRYGAASGEEMYADLERKIHELNEEQHRLCAKIKVTPNNQTIVAICTPLMKRVHEKMKHSGEIIYVDSSGNCDRHNSRIFVVLTHSSAGGLPLGMLITTSESMPTIQAGFSLLQSILPERAFFGRGAMGPQVIMTDDCKALRQGLHAVYPQSSLILCVFHLLQALWRWLWDTHNHISKQDRTYLLNTFKELIGADNSLDLESRFQQIQEDKVVARYQQFKEHLAEIFARRNAWALCLHQSANLPLRGNVTNNFVEDAMRVIKEKMFNRPKAFNVTQLFHFLVTRLTSYYEHRLIDVSNNQMTNPAQSKYRKDVKDVNVDGIIHETDSTYAVPSAQSEVVYYVDTNLEACTCTKGGSGGPCKHQYAVMKKFHVTNSNCLPATTPHQRKVFYQIATGRVDVPDEGFADLLPDEQADFLPDDDDMMVASTSNVRDTQIERQDSLHRDLQNNFSHRGQRTRTSSLSNKLDNMFETLRFKLDNDEESFHAPLTKFVERFEHITTDSALISALSTFGKYNSGFALSKNSSHVGQRRAMLTSKKIGVQPTAVSRMKTTGGRRRAPITGRPVKGTQKEHS
ncbi:uncharacterized protein LOC135156449 [Lytechinus pictus]|uniref:uncharacterized protein LOC135156449 n=1 Tax=Lytechinus pictus TaxID=7653 RepID=UPI0030B9D935